MAFNYFYGKQADQYGFVRIPKLLMTEKMFLQTQSFYMVC